MVSALNDKENEITPGILQCMENIRDTFHRNGKFPRPEYKQFSYGWVSSMDAPVIMLASQMLYEKTNDLKWKEFVDELVEYIVLPVEKGGFNLYYSTKKGEKAVWPLEYADKNSTEINSQFVLNGSLTGYLSTKIVADIRRDKILLDYCEKVKLAYKDKFTEFHYEKYPWTYYMLNPKKVIPPHYIIFEVELLSAISKIDQDKIFEEELNFRRDALKSVLGLQFRESGEGIEWIIRRACAPHPYLIDIYASKIVFYDKKNKVLSSYENDISGSLAENRNRFSEGEWIQGGVSKNAVKYDYFVRKKGNEIKLFSGQIKSEQQRAVKYSILPEVYYDGKVVDDNEIIISASRSEKQEARLIWTLPEAENLCVNNYYAIELNNLSEKEFSIGYLLYDSEGNGVGRYYTELIPGKNVLLLNEIGFSDINTLKNIKKIGVRIYTNEENEEAILTWGSLYKFNDLFEMKSYRENYEGIVVPQ